MFGSFYEKLRDWVIKNPSNLELPENIHAIAQAYLWASDAIASSNKECLKEAYFWAGEAARFGEDFSDCLDVGCRLAMAIARNPEFAQLIESIGPSFEFKVIDGIYQDMEVEDGDYGYWRATITILVGNEEFTAFCSKHEMCWSFNFRHPGPLFEKGDRIVLIGHKKDGMFWIEALSPQRVEQRACLHLIP